MKFGLRKRCLRFLLKTGQAFNIFLEREMSKIKIQLVEEEETPSTWEMMWDYLITFLKCVGLFVAICFAIGYFSVDKPQTTQCEPTKTVLAKGIFK